MKTPQFQLDWNVGFLKALKPVLLLLLLTGTLSDCSAGGNHSLSVTPLSISFGTQPINATAQNPITITNDGSHALQIQALTLSGSGVFALKGWGGPVTLQPSQSLQVGITFIPTSSGNYSAKLTIYSNASVDPVVTIIGSGAAANITVSPTAAVVQAGKSQQFKASVTATSNTTVQWLVNGTPGGNSNVGTVSSSGLYTAPAAVSSNTSVMVTAADGTGQANANVTITPPPTPVSVSISPTSTSVQAGQTRQFTASVSGTTNTAVNWLVAGIIGGNSSGGTISSTGVYTAPLSVPLSPVTVTAQSEYDSTSWANATVTVTPGSAQITSITVTPTNQTVAAGTQVQFKAIDNFGNDITSSVAWSSSDPSIVAITAGGLATGIASGAATITASK
jgi:uncharacterized protein (AIM24 family)